MLQAVAGAMVFVQAAVAQETDSVRRADVIVPDSVELTAVHSLSELLSSRVPGLIVQQTTGTEGMASRIWIRGPGSLMLGNDPLVIVDGVRVLTAPYTWLDIGPQLPSRLDDIGIEDIESIEVLKGPAAAWRYGTGAAGGVIRVNTKRARAGRFRLRGFADAGPVEDVTSYPANFGRLGVTTGTGEPIKNCHIAIAASGGCIPQPGGLIARSPLEEVSPFRTGGTRRFGATASGGTSLVAAFAAADVESSDGAYTVSSLERTRLRVNLESSPHRSLSLRYTSSLMTGENALVAGGNTTDAVLAAALFGRADSVNHGYQFFTPAELFQIDRSQESDRRIISLSAAWSPTRRLRLSARWGQDNSETHDHQFIPASMGSADSSRRTGANEGTLTTIAAGASLSYSLGAHLIASSHLAFERNDRKLSGDDLIETHFGAQRLFASQVYRLRTGSNGVLLEQRVGWRDRLFVTAGVRRDESREGDFDFDVATYPAMSVRWMLDREPFFPSWNAIDALTLHASYGEAGRRIVTGVEGLDFPFFFTPPVWDPKVERTKELEVGASASLLRTRIDVGLAYYTRRSTDIVAFRTFNFSPTRELQDARIKHNGVEGHVAARLVDANDVRLSLNVGAWFGNTEVLRIPVPAFESGFAVPRQFSVEGHPVAAYFDRPFLGFQDNDGDGTIEMIGCPEGPGCEVVLGSEPVYLGSSLPTREVMISPRVTLFGRVELSALLDHRGGNKQANMTEFLRCLGDICRGIQGEGASLRDQARAVSADHTSGGFIEDASFWKLRELAVSLEAPEAWAARIHARSVRLTLAGRNLATWTDYSGLDPEINGGGPLGLAQGEVVTQPPLRYYTARLSVEW